MPSLREIKSHITSVRSISQVTKALEVVSAAKNHRLQDRMASTRAFADKSWQVLTHLAASATDMAEMPIFRGRSPVRRIALVLMTSNRGMVGSYDSDIIGLALRHATTRDVETDFITIGRIGRNALLHLERPIHADFSQIEDKADITQLTPVAQVALEGYEDETFDEVWIASTRLQSGVRLIPSVERLLPIQSPQPALPRQYIYEPDPNQIIAALAPRIVRFRIYQAFLEAVAAENAARTVAMHTATHNANDLLKHLRVSYNNVRQRSITSEILDIVNGSAAQRQGQSDHA